MIRDGKAALTRTFGVALMAAVDRRTPLLPRLISVAGIAYYFSGYDLIPNTTLVGYVDEICILPLSLYLAYRLLPNDLLVELGARAETFTCSGLLTPLAASIGTCPRVTLAAMTTLLAATWCLLPAILNLALPLDVVECGMWGREWIIGSWKHPALPSWCLEVARWLTGDTLGWSAYLTSEFFIVVTLALTFALVRDLLDVRSAAAATVALMGVEHFSWRSPEFNHNIAMMPFWLGTFWCAWRAVGRQSLLWWCCLGGIGALGLYAKLSHIVALIATLAWMVADVDARRTFRTVGPWIASGIFIVLVIPLGIWLIDTHFGAIAFARSRGKHPGALSLLVTFGKLGLVLLPAAVALIVAGAPKLLIRDWTWRRRDWFGSQSRHSRFLSVATLGPLAISILLATASVSGLRSDWFVPMLCLVPAYAISVTQPSVSARFFASLVIITAIYMIAMPIGYAAVVMKEGYRERRHVMRVNWPQEDIASQLAHAWSSQTTAPLRIVAGPDWEAGLVGLNHPDEPSILLDGDMARSPWITPERLEREGALVVWSDQGAAKPSLLALVKNRPASHLWFQFPRAAKGRGVTISYLVIEPAQTRQ